MNQALPEQSAVVMEACWNWGWLYDQLGTMLGVSSVVLAHPRKIETALGVYV